MFIPNKSVLAEKLVEEVHLQTIHGEVNMRPEYEISTGYQP